jgi:magnesium-transporting ATPase (P-type)
MGIRVWLLTGDKMETAINIGMSSALISKQMNLVVLTGQSISQVQDALQAAQSSLKAALAEVGY